MLHDGVIIFTAFAYLGLLFAIAYFADKRADAGRPVIASPYVYSLSLAVYATAWTFYGSVGRAASDGVGFLPIYIGPTLMIALWWVVMRKILRISKQNRITSLADFIASRYGKSALLGGLVTVIAVIGILPYISLQLKAVSNSFTILVQYPEIIMPTRVDAAPMRQDTALWVAMILAAFTMAFGTRHLDAAEHHQGMVAAIAFESLVKLLAFLAVGVFVTFGIYDGFGDLFARAAAEPKLLAMMTPLGGVAGGYASWVWLTILSMTAIMFLPRQFQVAVIENVDEKHLSKAIWLFPLYMLAINVFVLPIAFGGLLTFGDGTQADSFILALPLRADAGFIAVNSTSTTSRPFVFVMFRYSTNGVTVTESSVAAQSASMVWSMFVESAGNLGASGSIQSGIAIAHNEADGANIHFELFGSDGKFIGGSSNIQIPGRWQTSMFLNQIPGLPPIPSSFRGVLRVWSDRNRFSRPGVSVTGLRGRYNERGEFLFTSTPAIAEVFATTSSELLFPHFAIGGGYETEFVLFSDNGSSGTVYFFDQNGNPLSLGLQ